MEYPGRFIIIGLSSDGTGEIVVYGITGRSPSSQARKLVREDDVISVQPTDEALVKEGRADLLIYPAILHSNCDGIAVSNGKQTTPVSQACFKHDTGHALENLAAVHKQWSYEPDTPNFTPRISGMLYYGPRSAALGIIKREGGDVPVRHYFEVPLLPGKGKLISTYTGENVNPLQSFHGEPRDVDLPYDSSAETAQAVYTAIAPLDPRRDYRVAVAVVLCRFDGPWKDVAIINRGDV
jgi:IMP cyclohydrolase